VATYDKLKLLSPTARDALRATQCWYNLELYPRLLETTNYEVEFEYDELRSVVAVSNLDKHRRLLVSGWGNFFVYWSSDRATTREMLPPHAVDDADVLGYFRDSSGDPDANDAHWSFDLVAIEREQLPRTPLMQLVEGWQRRVQLAIASMFRDWSPRGA
jgi:hypothetical protein